MKINYALVFVIIAYALISIKNFETVQMKRVEHLGLRYNWAIDTATDDAALVLAKDKILFNKSKDKVNKELAVETFFRTLELNFGIEEGSNVFTNTIDTDSNDEYFINYGDKNSRMIDREFLNNSFKQYLRTYVPCILVIDYDGYYISSLQEYTHNGNTRIEHLFGPKKYFSHLSKDGNIINFTVEDKVSLIKANTYQYETGTREEIGNTTGDSLLLDPVLFEDIRRTTITTAIENDLHRVIGNHNKLANMYGINYVFTLPTVEDEEWNNVIDDIGVVTFIQGIPMGSKRYNNYAFAGGRVTKAPIYYGAFVEKNGSTIWVYHRNECISLAEHHEVFYSKESAAKEGYFPCADCRP